MHSPATPRVPPGLAPRLTGTTLTPPPLPSQLTMIYATESAIFSMFLGSSAGKSSKSVDKAGVDASGYKAMMKNFDK